MLPVHQRLIHWLEERGDLDRALEFLPADAEIGRRRDDQLGPHLAGVLACWSPTPSWPSSATCCRPACPTTRGSSGPCVDYFPTPLGSGSASGCARAPAAPRDRHQRRRQLDGQPGRNHLRLPRRRRDRGHGRSRSPGPSWSAARCSGCRRSSATSRRSTTACRPSAQTALYLEFRRLLDRAVRWFIQNRPSIRSTSPPRSSGSGPSVAAIAPHRPGSCSVASRAAPPRAPGRATW